MTAARFLSVFCSFLMRLSVFTLLHFFPLPAYHLFFLFGRFYILSSFHILHMLQTVQKCLNPGHHTDCRLVFIHLHRQIRLVSHNLPEHMGNHGVRAAAVVGQIHGIQIRMVFDDLRPSQNVLAEWPVQVWVLPGQIHAVSLQMCQVQYFAAAL